MCRSGRETETCRQYSTEAYSLLQSLNTLAMCKQSGDDLIFYIYNKRTECAKEANRGDAKKKASLKNRQETGFEILMFEKQRVE